MPENFSNVAHDPGRTLLGGDALDLVGFDSLVHNHDRSHAIRMRFELDLSKAKLPFQNYFTMEEWQSLVFHLPKLGEAIKVTASNNWELTASDTFRLTVAGIIQGDDNDNALISGDGSFTSPGS